jgi:hypothetical protein
MKQESNMLQNIFCKSALALVLSLAVVGTAGAGDDYGKGNDHSKKGHEYSKKKDDDKKRHDDKKKHDKKRHDDKVVAYNDTNDDSYDDSYDDPKMDNINFDCSKKDKFPANNEKLCEKLGGEFSHLHHVKKCVIDKDPYRVTCKLPKKYPFEADITAATKVFIRVGNLCVTRKLPGEIVACFNSHGKPVRASKCEDKGCFPDEDNDHGHDDGYGRDDDRGHDGYGRDDDYKAEKTKY